MKKVLAAIVIGTVLALGGFTHRDQLTARMSCAEKVAHQFTTTSVVQGAYTCINPDVRYILKVMYGINDAKDFASAIGAPKESYSYLGQGNDGGYTYRFDYPTTSHNSFNGAFNDVVKGFNLKGAWKEVNGETQGWVSTILTFYLNPSGYHDKAIDGKTYDYSGTVNYIK